MTIEGHQLIINKYEFDEYLEVMLDGEIIILSFDEIIYFISNEMTNGLTNLNNDHYQYLYQIIKNK